MLQLTYISTAKIASEADIASILAASRRNNVRDNITGLLLYNGKRFLQALEGPDDEVLAAYDRIHADPRHRAAVILTSATVEQRQFGRWEMAYEEVRAMSNSNALIETVDALVANVTDRNVKAHFTSYVRLQNAA